MTTTQFRRARQYSDDGKVNTKTYNIDMDALASIVNAIANETAGVTQITAGTGIYVSPSGGQGNVTVSALTQQISKWDVTGRPASPVVGESFGYNTTYSSIEIYTSYGWYIYGGTWTTVGRPVTPALGSTGYNTTIGSREYYDGSGPDGWNNA